MEGADRIYRQLLEALFGAEDEQSMKRAWQALEAEGRWRVAQAEKSEGEHRRKTGAPIHVALVGQDDLDAARSEWESITGATPADEDPEVDPEAV